MVGDAGVRPMLRGSGSIGGLPVSKAGAVRWSARLGWERTRSHATDRAAFAVSKWYPRGETATAWRADFPANRATGSLPYGQASAPSSSYSGRRSNCAGDMKRLKTGSTRHRVRYHRSISEAVTAGSGKVVKQPRDGCPRRSNTRGRRARGRPRGWGSATGTRRHRVLSLPRVGGSRRSGKEGGHRGATAATSPSCRAPRPSSRRPPGPGSRRRTPPRRPVRETTPRTARAADPSISSAAIIGAMAGASAEPAIPVRATLPRSECPHPT